MIDNINLIEYDTRIEDVERRVIQRAGEDNVFHELETVCVMDLLLDGFISYWYGLVKTGALVEEFAVVGFVHRELGIV